MKYSQIVEIKLALENLGKERLPIAFEVAKNLRICNKVMDEVQAVAKDIQDKYWDRDENGELKVYTDDKGNKNYKISDPEKVKECIAALEPLNTEEHQIELLKIKRAKLENLTNYELTMPLIDTLIEE